MFNFTLAVQEICVAVAKRGYRVDFVGKVFPTDTRVPRFFHLVVQDDETGVTRRMSLAFSEAEASCPFPVVQLGVERLTSDGLSTLHNIAVDGVEGSYMRVADMIIEEAKAAVALGPLPFRPLDQGELDCCADVVRRLTEAKWGIKVDTEYDVKDSPRIYYLTVWQDTSAEKFELQFVGDDITLFYHKNGPHHVRFPYSARGFIAAAIHEIMETH